MAELDKVINGLEHCVKGYCIDCPYDDKCEAVGGIYNLASDALELLKEQEESIPVSWLTEKLEGHPELSYAVTDGINNVLDLWEGR